MTNPGTTNQGTTMTNTPPTIRIQSVGNQWVGQLIDDDGQWTDLLPLPFTPEAGFNQVADFYTGRGMTVVHPSGIQRSAHITALPRCEYCGGRHEWTHTTRDAIRWGIRRNNLRALSLAFTMLDSE